MIEHQEGNRKKSLYGDSFCFPWIIRKFSWQGGHSSLKRSSGCCWASWWEAESRAWKGGGARPRIWGLTFFFNVVFAGCATRRNSWAECQAWNNNDIRSHRDDPQGQAGGSERTGENVFATWNFRRYSSSWFCFRLTWFAHPGWQVDFLSYPLLPTIPRLQPRYRGDKFCKN